MGENQYTDDDRYVVNLPYHLVNWGNEKALSECLLDFEFIQYKFSALNTQSLIDDYEFALRSDIIFTEENRNCLTIIRDTIVLSADIINRDQSQLAGQLTARLLGSKLNRIQYFLDAIKRWTDLSWIRLTLPVLTIPGGPLLKTLRGHRGWIWALLVTLEGRQVVSTDGYSIKLWDIGRGKELFSYSPDVFTTAIAATPDGKKIAYSEDEVIRILDIGTGTNFLSLTGHTGSVTAIAMTPDGEHVVSGSSDKTIRVWALRTGRELLTMTGHSDSVILLAVTPNGTQVISGSSDNTYKLWEICDGRELFTFGDPSKKHIYARTIAITHDSEYLVCSLGSDIAIFNIKTGASHKTIKNCGWRIYSTVLSIDGKHIIASSYENCLRVWDFATGEPKGSFSGHQRGVFALAASPVDNLIISGSQDTTLKVWDVSKLADKSETAHALESWVRPFNWGDGQGNGVRQEAAHVGPIHSISITPDDELIITATASFPYKRGTTKLIYAAMYDPCRVTYCVRNIHNGEVIKVLPSRESDFSWGFALTITPDGRKVICGSHDHTIKIWNIVSGEMTHCLVGHTDWVEAVTVCWKRKCLISASFDKTLKIWDIESGALLHTLEGHAGPVVALAVTQCERKVISTSWDGTLRVWDIHTGKLSHAFKGGDNYQPGNLHFVNALAISPDGQQVLHTVEVVPPGENAIAIPSVPYNSLLRIWTPRTKKKSQLRDLGGPISSVQVVRFSSDGRLAVSGSYDGSLRVWDVKTAELIATYYGESPFWSCAVASDGATIVAGDEVGRVHYLRLEGMETSSH